MNMLLHSGAFALLCVLGIPLRPCPMCSPIDPAGAVANAQPPAAVQDGQRDFDFELGSWKIHLKRLEHPLTGSTKWVEFDGTSVTSKVWDGRAELEQFETEGAG